MKRAHGRIGDAAAAAKQKTNAMIEATAELAERAMLETADDLHRAGDALNDASARLAKSAAKSLRADARPLKLVD
jgi:hypothetical protein